jgi:CMP-N,N'-diacetyllegionaminic acid synthase
LSYSKTYKKEFICIIPARGGSKGIKNKNIKLLNSKPLIYWTIKEALKIKEFLKVIVSTDTEKIQKIAQKFGAECSFLRPKKISLDSSHVIGAIKHTINYLKKKKFDNFKYIVILQPTSPLRSKLDIKKSINFFLKRKYATSLVSVVQVGDNHPARMYYLEKDKLIKNQLSETNTGNPRQKLKKMYLRNGAIYILKKNNVKKNFLGKTPVGFLMSRLNSLNIDELLDFKIAQYLINKKK